MVGILWVIAVILLLFWAAGLVLDIVGGAIHILLVIALAVVLWNLITGRRTA